jgi:hypothetical protein
VRAMAPAISGDVDFILATPGLLRHQYLRRLFALSQRMTQELFVRSVERAHRYCIRRCDCPGHTPAPNRLWASVGMAGRPFWNCRQCPCSLSITLAAIASAPVSGAVGAGPPLLDPKPPTAAGTPGTAHPVGQP